MASWFSPMIFNSERWNSINWQFCHLGKWLDFLSIFIYIMKRVVIPTSRIAVFSNWRNQCSDVDNVISQVMSVSCPNSIWYYSAFHVLSPKGFLFILFPFMSHRFSDYLKPITRIQASKSQMYPSDTMRAQLINCCSAVDFCIHAGLPDKTLSFLTFLAHRKILYSQFQMRDLWLP